MYGADNRSAVHPIMDEHEFYEQVQDRADFDGEEDAIAITHATLQTLSQRISEEQARDLAPIPRRPARR